MEELKDDWLFDSLYRYERLHMFELPHATRCLEWADQSGTCLCVGGFSDKHANEIEMLELPEVLQPKAYNDVCAHTDFRITCGGLTKSPVTAIKCIGSKKVLATAGSEACVDLWMKDVENTDLLTLYTSLKLRNETGVASTRPALIDHTLDAASLLITGKTAGSVTVWDLNSNAPLSSPGPSSSASRDVLHSLKFVGPHLFVTCSGEQGQLSLWDFRTPLESAIAEAQPPTPAPCGDQSIPSGGSSFALSVDRSGTRVAVLSAGGVVSMFEARQLGTALCSCVLDCGRKWPRLSGGGRFSGTGNAEPASLCLEFSCNGTKMAVSGISNGVSIYDISSWSSLTPGTAAAPLFVHTGHEADCPGVTVLTHTWHPTAVDTVMSVDSEGNLHAWQGKQK